MAHHRLHGHDVFDAERPRRLLADVVGADDAGVDRPELHGALSEAAFAVEVHEDNRAAEVTLELSKHGDSPPYNTNVYSYYMRMFVWYANIFSISTLFLLRQCF